MKNLKNIKAVIFDWDGTIIDYGCIAPMQVFIEVFKEKDIIITMEEARIPMGLAKKDHFRELFRLGSVQKQWYYAYGRVPSEMDVELMYLVLEPSLSVIVKNYCEPIPGAVDLIENLKKQGIKVGTTTGYVTEMMQNILSLSFAKGLIPDSTVTISEVSYGRPAPWMIYKNCEKMNVFPLSQMVKIGDTLADIQEGINAGMWTIGLTKSGNELGLSLSETEKADPIWMAEKIALAGRKMINNGADFVAEGVWDCWPILEEIDEQIESNNSIGENIEPSFTKGKQGSSYFPVFF